MNALLLLAAAATITANLGETALAAPGDSSTLTSCATFSNEVHGQQLRIEAHGDHGIRVRAVPKGAAFRDDLVSALVPLPNADATAAGTGCTTLAAGAGIVTSGNLRAVVLADGRLSFTRVSDGKLLLEEKSVRELSPTTTVPPILPMGFQRLRMVFSAVEGERIYGLGQHKSGKLDNKGTKGLRLQPENTEILIPVAHSSEGYVFLFNLPSFGAVEYNSTGSFWEADTVLQADFWVGTTADGPEHAVSPWVQLQTRYADATGHAPVYPEWASGFWQSKNRYHNQSQVMDVARGYEQRGLPLALMIIDYFSWAPTPLGNEQLAHECWPDPGGMVETLRDQGVELMVSPYFHMVTNISKNFADALARGLLVGNGTDPALGPARDQEFSGAGGLLKGVEDAYIYDVFSAESREYAWQQVVEGYVKPYGIKHWWLDCDEPCGVLPTDHLVYNGGHWPASFVGAAYPHMLARMVFDGMGQLGLAGDNVMLGRSAWAGSQRFGAAVWSGDTRSNFTSLQLQFKAGLNLVMSGLPYWTTDIGGYNMYNMYEGGIENPRFRQLLVRWFQWGAFCPLFRLHGGRQGGPSQEGGNKACGATNSANEVWMFGDEAEAAISRAMRIREQLRPYIMEQYAEAAASGTPIMRPLFVDFHDDSASQTIDTQMMLGPDFLVAPQLEENATNRTVYLPPLPGEQTWRNFFTGVRTQPRGGGQWVVEQTPTHGEGLGTFPVYQVRKMPSWPRSWANFSLSQLYSHRNAWANLHILGQPNTFLASARRGQDNRSRRHICPCWGRQDQGC
jgi:alpha-D-xyloside xylohydrolase